MIYRSDRRFTLVSYHTSYGLLLWRSGKTAEHPTRCDILFLDVRAMELRVWIDRDRLTGVARSPTPCRVPDGWRQELAWLRVRRLGLSSESLH